MEQSFFIKIYELGKVHSSDHRKRKRNKKWNKNENFKMILCFCGSDLAVDNIYLWGGSHLLLNVVFRFTAIEQSRYE